MFNLSYFERLIETVTLLVRHPEYPSKRRALEQCRHEVTELIRGGRISVPEAEMLYEILDTYPLASGSVARAERAGEVLEAACCPTCAGAEGPG